MRPWRALGACVLLALGLGLVWYGWTIVDNIWGPGDSSATGYLLFGLPLIAVGICCLVAAGLVVRRRNRGSGP